MNKRGEVFEDQACDYLQQLGYTILERNYFCRFGEIDVIAQNGKYTVFVEVKYRQKSNFGHPVETITTAKQEKLLKTALTYLEEHGEDYYRFDAIVILDDKLEHLKNIMITGSD